MTQIATIEKLLDAGHAEIAVARQSACGHDCAECAGCGVSAAPVYARASNPIGARPGQKVVVQSSTKNILGITLLVYMVPVALFFLGYALGGFFATAAARLLWSGGIGRIVPTWKASDYASAVDDVLSRPFHPRRAIRERYSMERFIRDYRAAAEEAVGSGG